MPFLNKSLDSLNKFQSLFFKVFFNLKYNSTLDLSVARLMRLAFILVITSLTNWKTCPAVVE